MIEGEGGERGESPGVCVVSAGSNKSIDGKRQRLARQRVKRRRRDIS